MSPKDENKTRIDIDELLEKCGFVVQDKANFNRFAIAPSGTDGLSHFAKVESPSNADKDLSHFATAPSTAENFNNFATPQSPNTSTAENFSSHPQAENSKSTDKNLNHFATPQNSRISGVAVREFVMNDGSAADYALFVDGKACGIIEAKKEGATLSGAQVQSKHYAAHFPSNVKAWREVPPFIYESNGGEIYFTDLREPAPRARRVFAFHTPEFLLELLTQNSTLRERLAKLPATPLFAKNLRPCQIEAITALENSFAANKPRALIQMATGAGKTFTACNFIYRLLAHAGARRVLFLVDRNNLGEQAKKEFDNFRTHGDNRKFSEIYITTHLQSNAIAPDSKLVITTIQRLYSILKGEAEFDGANEQRSYFDASTAKVAPPKELAYNENVPISFFDFIIVDECHRSIYGEWRQVLEYFDAFIVGLSATPSKHTLGFFGQNLVSEYPLTKSIIDGVNVDYQIFRIRTQISENGAVLLGGEGFVVPKRDKRTRRTIYEQLDEDTPYTKQDLDKTVLSPNQIRTILQCYKNALFTQLFPERAATNSSPNSNLSQNQAALNSNLSQNSSPNSNLNQIWIPKTLIFAKDDAHAEEIVRAAREVFNAENEFCQKITYNIGKQSPRDLIAAFRNEAKFRIAVTVDMIATGTDIKPLEVLIFMRDVKSQLYFEQMLGRGVRTINPTDLKGVTPNAHSKTHFFVIDAVGVSESQKSISAPLERKGGVSFKKLLDNVALGANDEDTISSLASRLAKLTLNATREQNEQVKNLSGGKDLQTLASDLQSTIEPEFMEGKSAEEIEQARDAALFPFNEPSLREFLLDLAQKCYIYIDELTPDAVITAEFSEQKAAGLIASFREFIHAHKDELGALSIIYTQSYKSRHLTRALIDELYARLRGENLSIASLWGAYALTQKERVKAPRSGAEKLTNLVQLVRFELGFDEQLRDFGGVANSRFELFKGRQLKRNGAPFTPEQAEFLAHIKDYIIENGYIESADIQALNDAHGDDNAIYVARALFGANFATLFDELNVALFDERAG